MIESNTHSKGGEYQGYLRAYHFFSTKASSKYILLEKIVVVDGLRAEHWAQFLF